MSSTLYQTIVITVPIVLLIGIGAMVRAIGLLKPSTLDELKGLIVNIALPAVLFKAFLTMEFSRSYLGLMVFPMAVCLMLLGVGYAVRRMGKLNRYTPYLMTGFEFGMLGIPLFTAAYGMQQTGVIAVIGVGHEPFIWFVLVTLLAAVHGGKQSAGSILKSFARSPLIISIVSAVALNLLGAGEWFQSVALGQALLRTADLLGGVIVPLILIVVGYGMRVAPREIAGVLPVVLIRYAVVMVLAIVVGPWLVRSVLGLRPIFVHALFTFLILPPPYIVPLYIPQKETTDMRFTNTMLSVYTILSIVTFLVYVAFTAGR